MMGGPRSVLSFSFCARQNWAWMYWMDLMTWQWWIIMVLGLSWFGVGGYGLVVADMAKTAVDTAAVIVAVTAAGAKTVVDTAAATSKIAADTAAVVTVAATVAAAAEMTGHRLKPKSPE